MQHKIFLPGLISHESTLLEVLIGVRFAPATTAVYRLPLWAVRLSPRYMRALRV
jgi:hypothetical protein